MLVLSRRTRESIVFPTVGVTVQIVRIAGKTVRLGIQAPASLPVLRNEVLLEKEIGTIDQVSGSEGSDDREKRHRLLGRLNTATVAIHLAERQLVAGQTSEADATLQTALRELKELDDLVREPALTPKPAEPVRRIRTLLVEDNPFESSLLASYLRMSGFEVDRVGDGQEALEYLETHEVPDAMLLDMHLPRFDGPSTVAAIRANPTWSKLKIIAVTGSRPEDLDLPNYVDGWFHKPLNPCQLVDSLLQSVA